MRSTQSGHHTETEPASLRCSQSARARQLDPIGSVESYDGFAFVEVPLPWPRDVTSIPHLARMQASSEGEYGGRWRLQAIAPADAGARDAYQILMYRRSAQGVAAYEAVGPAPDRLVLVCTHGTRDRCCGTLGAAMFYRLKHLPGVHLRRTSHTGGHRFAPTATIFPEGSGWAYLDAGLLAEIVQRTAPIDLAARHYRGCVGLEAPELQVADREAMIRHGWAWLDTPRTGRVVAREGAHVVARLEAPGVVHEVVLEGYDSSPVLQSCAKQTEGRTSTERQWRVESFA